MFDNSYYFTLFMFFMTFLFVLVELFDYYRDGNTLQKEEFVYNGHKIEQVVLNKAGVQYIQQCIDDDIYTNVFKLVCIDNVFSIRSINSIKTLEVQGPLFITNRCPIKETAFITDESKENVKAFVKDIIIKENNFIDYVGHIGID